MKWAGDQWSRFFRAIFGHVHPSKAAISSIGDVVVVLAIAVVIIVVIRLMASALRASVLPSAHPLLMPAPVRAATLYEHSLAAAQRGDYARAIALLYRAAVTALDLGGVLADEPSRTVNECRRAVDDTAPAYAQPFDALAKSYTAVAYAERPADAARWNAALEAFRPFAAMTAHGR